MPLPVQVVFHDVERSPAIEDVVHRHVGELERHFDRITGCRVVIEAPHRKQHRGRVYSVRIDISVPRREIMVDKDRHDRHSHEDVYVAIHDAFKAATRRLDDYARRLRGEVKHHQER